MLSGRRNLILFAELLIIACVAVIWSPATVAHASDAATTQAETPAPNLQPVSETPLVVRGRVIRTESYWNADHTLIESRNILALESAPSGTLAALPGQESAQQVAVYTLGGELPDGMGMLVSDAPTLQQGEEVVLSLRRSLQDVNGYEITGGQNGKVLLQSASVDGLGARQYVYNNYKWPTSAVSYLVNTNTQQAGGDSGSQDDFLAAIRRAANTWTYAGEADITFTYAGATVSTKVGFNGANEIIFVNEGLVDAAGNTRPLATALVFYMNSTIVETDIKINDAYTWNAAGVKLPAAFDLQSVVLHELGHWLGLGHDEDDQAVMYAVMAVGTAKRALFADDLQGIAALYPCTAGANCNPEAPADPPFIPDPVTTSSPGATNDPAPEQPAVPSPELYLPLVRS
jgi:hypothetical protein